ncbi:hypothetical protein SLEP1_g48722 [Rubroshorea leprosula]|nr:hypothetical protein SLEP1_g48722 [Rubroshorea leprosula]
MQGELVNRVAVVDANLRTQLEQPEKIENPEVKTWLENARQEIAKKVIDDLICKGGCFTYICSSRKLDKETQALEVGILKQGEKYTNTGAILVMDDHSIQSRVRVFEDKQKEVKHLKEKVEAELMAQLRRQPGKIAWNSVKDWLKKASQMITMKVEDLISQGECSSSTNIEKKVEDLISQGECSSSTNIGKKIEELRQILEEGRKFTNFGVSLVIDDPSKKGITMLAEKCIARDDVQEEILQLLRGDKITRIAVCGMGGVGKTTIMQQVYSQLLKDSKQVIWVKVSKDFDVVVQQKKQFDMLKFQKSIARKLQLDLKNADQDEIELAGLIADRLQQGSHVLILDDVWESFSIKHVGIPDGCKLVLTTRLQQEVGRAMECEVIPVMPLPNDEALALFLDKVGSEVVSYPRYKSDIEPFLNQILKKCNGLPLAIVVVAKTMRGKFDRYLWERADKELRKSEEVDYCLKFSYDHLEEQSKNCFLYCALYPEDHEIQIEELIEFWIEEGFIEDESGSRHSMICEGHSIIQKLVDYCMLESVKRKYVIGDFYLGNVVNHKNKEDRVSVHDLLRDMALKIIPQFMVKAGVALEELPKEVEGRKDLLKISLMKSQIREFPSSMLSLKCPMLTTLLLSENNITTIPEAFFDHMPKLKILDLSGNYHLCRLPSSISKLESLTTLLLDNCGLSLEVPSLSNLGELKKLSFYETVIRELPQGLNMLTNLEYFWFDVPSYGSYIPDGLLQNLSKLQYLVVGGTTPLKWEEVGRLRKLESLYCWLSTLDDMSLLVKSERKLKQYRILVGNCSSDDANYACCYMKTFLNVVKSIVCYDIDLCEKPNWLPSDVQNFYIKDCKDVRSLDDISGLKEAIDLRHCTVDACDGMEFVVSSHCLKLLQNLESLYLFSLKELNAVVGVVEAVAKSAPLPAGTFLSLQKIEVYRCRKIKKLWPLRLLRYLQNLKIIKVGACRQMEELISSSTYEEKEAPEKITLPNLQCLKLMQLRELKSICSSSSVLICDSINRLLISNCKKLKRIPLHLSSLDNGQPSSLKEIEVDTKEHWESLEWDQSKAKVVLSTYCKFLNDSNIDIEEEEEMSGDDNNEDDDDEEEEESLRMG